MSKTYLYAALGAGALLVLIAVVAFMRRRKRRRPLKTEAYAERWKTLQKNCATRKTWPKAIVEADDLLDDVLKARHFKGKTPGERLVSAQREITENDKVWFGHKLRNKIVDEDVRTLKKQDILDALYGFREALKDLGALDK